MGEKNKQEKLSCNDWELLNSSFYQKRVDGRIDGQDKDDEPGVQIGRNVDISQRHDFQKNSRHPTQAIGEDDKKETDGYFDFVGCQRRGRPGPSDAHEQCSVDAHNHQDAERDSTGAKVELDSI